MATSLQSIVASNTGSDDWSKAGNWLASEPNATGATAVFGSAITAPRTITLNASRSLGRMRIDNANRYTIAGSGSLSFSDPSGTSTLEVLSGNHTVDVPIALTQNATFSISAGSSLVTSNQISTSSAITKTGSGTLDVRNIRAASLNVSAGTVSVRTNGNDTGTSKVQSLAIAAAASLDLNDNDLITANGNYNAVTSLIRTARNGGLWNQAGLTSSAAANANPKNRTLGALTGAEFHTAQGAAASFDGFTVADSDVLVKYTYYGDTDFNGLVDFDDYSRIDAGFNNNRTGWFNGDFDYNGVVDFDDYSLIDQAFNTQSGTLRSAIAVREPRLMLAVLVLAPLIRRRRRL